MCTHLRRCQIEHAHGFSPASGFLLPWLSVAIWRLSGPFVCAYLGVCLLKRFGFVRLALCFGILLPGIREASALDVTLSADASVNSAHATNYGGLSNLYVGNGNTTFLKFDLKTLPTGTTAAQVTQATL